MSGFRMSRVLWALALSLGSALMVLGTPVVASATGAPTIKSFTVSPSSVSSAGGKVTLTAKVGRAKTCTFSFTPHVGGLPATLKCSSDVYKRQSESEPSDDGSKA